jgi:uncharacterized protein YceH (UPF0502 family)
VLGSLIEKDMTTPEYYPLTLNALVNACNQKSSREPVVNYNEDTVLRALESLKHQGMAVRISGAGHRVEKYAHSLGEKLNLGRREMALLSVLMLRGAQTVGELRGRTERMHDFADMEEVERCLNSLASRDAFALVAPQPRGRWAQLLGGNPESVAEPLAAPSSVPAAGSSRLEQRVETLEAEVAELKRQLDVFRKQFE